MGPAALLRGKGCSSIFKSLQGRSVGNFLVSLWLRTWQSSPPRVPRLVVLPCLRIYYRSNYFRVLNILLYLNDTFPQRGSIKRAQDVCAVQYRPQRKVFSYGEWERRKQDTPELRKPHVASHWGVTGLGGRTSASPFLLDFSAVEDGWSQFS